MRQRPTLKTMAATLGVHVSTVSRILNGDPSAAKGAASAELTERVRNLARELNYRPNAQASSLRTQRSRDIAVLLPRLAEPLCAQWHEGLEHAARAAGYQLLACATLDDPVHSLQRVQHLLERPLAGVVVADARPGEQAVLDALAAEQLPCVLLGRLLPGVPGVGCDNAQAGRQVAHHFLNTGRTRAGILVGHAAAALNVEACIEGFTQQWAQAHGAPPLVHQGEPQALLASGVDAVWALDDVLALKACSTAQHAGIDVGTRLAVVGYQDAPWAAHLPVPLSSVTVPAERMGRLALQVLLRHIGGKAGQPLLLAPRLTVRASG